MFSFKYREMENSDKDQMWRINPSVLHIVATNHRLLDFNNCILGVIDEELKPEASRGIGNHYVPNKKEKNGLILNEKLVFKSLFGQAMA